MPINFKDNYGGWDEAEREADFNSPVADDGDYTIDSDGYVKYTGDDKVRNPFVFDNQSQTDFDFALGISKFEVPPTAIEVSTLMSNAAGAYVLRSKTASKMSPGSRKIRVKIKIMFPSLDAAWNGPNSLRGLMTQFRSAPFLPVRNTYLNDVHGIDALALASLNVNTVPGLPYTMAAEIICYKFDWKSYVPYPGNFSDIFNWDQFEFYYARARKMQDDYINKPSISEGMAQPIIDGSGNVTYEDSTTGFYDWNMEGLQRNDSAYDDAIAQKFGPIVDDTLHRMELFYSDREFSTMIWMNRLGAQGVTDYQRALEIITNPDDDEGWIKQANDLFQYGLLKWFVGEEEVDPAVTAQDQIKQLLNNEDQIQTQFNAFIALASAAEYMIAHEENLETKTRLNAEINAKMLEIQKKRPGMDPNTARNMAIYYVVSGAGVIDTILTLPKLQRAFRDNSVKWLHEWEVPMRRMGLTNEDLYGTVIVDSVTVTTQNAIVSLPLVGKLDPTFQFMGGMGTQATVTMKVIGERAIKHMREVFDAVSVSASHNKDAGVTGFLGVKNELLNCMGMKYAMLDSFTVNTIEGTPHVYDVMMQLSDFDILQQKREMPTAIERIQMVEDSSVCHPMMRSHQILSNMNAYPDLPLPRMMYSRLKIKESSDALFREGLTIEQTLPIPGRYLDPDFYFKNINLDYVQRKEVEDADGNKVNTPTMGSNAGSGDGPSMTLQSLSSSFPNTFTTENPIDGMSIFQIAMSTQSMTKQELLDSIKDSTDNPQEQYNKPLTEEVINELEKLGVISDPEDIQLWTELWNQNEQFQQARENDLEDIGADTENAFTSQLVSSMTKIYEQNEPDAYRQMTEENIDASEGMLRAFPTYMVYLIDEGGKLLTFKLFDTFYGLQAVMGMDIMTDKEAPVDTAVIQFSNLYNKLSTPQWFDSYSMPTFIRDIYTTLWTTKNRVMGIVSEIESLLVTPGMRMQIRAGYSANPEALPIIFNGTVTEVTQGSVMTVVVQGDGAELAQITGQNYSSDASTYSFLGIPFVEPQDLILRYLGAGSTVWAQWQRRASMGMNPGDGTSGISHFGGILWNTDMFGGDKAFRAHIKQTTDRVLARMATKVTSIKTALTPNADAVSQKQENIDWFSAAASVLGVFSDNADEIMNQAIENWTNLSEDFELLKRNIYPGNGTGYRRFNTGTYAMTRHPLSLLGTATWALIAPSYMDMITNEAGQNSPLEGERTFKLNTGGKTNWEIFKACEHLLPNYVLGVRPFEHRSVLFYGKQSWLYTSAVIPIFDAEGLIDNPLVPKMMSSQELAEAGDTSALQVSPYTRNAYANHHTTIWFTQEAMTFAYAWLGEHRTLSEISKYLKFDNKEPYWDNFIEFISSSGYLYDLLLLALLEDDKAMPLFTLTHASIDNPAIVTDKNILSQAPTPTEDSKRASALYEYFSALYKQADIDINNLNNLLKDGSITSVEYNSAIARFEREKSRLQPLIDAVWKIWHTAHSWKQIIEFSGGKITSPAGGVLQTKMSQEFKSTLTYLWSLYVQYKYELSKGNTTIPLSKERTAYLAVIPKEAKYIEQALWRHAYDDLKTIADPNSRSMASLGLSENTINWKQYEFAANVIMKDGLIPWDRSGTNPWGSTGYGNTTSVFSYYGHPHVIDGKTTEEGMKLFGKGETSIHLPLSATNMSDSSLPVDPGAEKNNQAGVEALRAVAWLGTVVVGGIDNILDASYYNQAIASGQWDCLQDSAYYGLKAGTPEDTYAGAGMPSPDTAKDNQRTDWSKYLTDDIARLRKIQIMADNPFSREFAEPVLEVREPFSRFHYLNDMRHIVNNGIYADETNVANQIRAIAHNSNRNDSKKEVVVKADASIPASLTREKIVDTGLNYEMLSLHDLEDHKNMARGALKESLQQMYSGELVVIGDPKIRPFDFCYIWDTPNKMNGWCEINRVTHHIGMDTGFVSSLTVAPIVVVDDAYMFGMFTAAYCFNTDRLAREMIATNVAYGHVNLTTVQATFEQDTIDQIYQKSLAIVDGNAGSAKTMHMVGALVPAQAVMKLDKAKIDSLVSTTETISRSALDNWKMKWSNLVVSKEYAETWASMLTAIPSIVNQYISPGNKKEINQIMLDNGWYDQPGGNTATYNQLITAMSTAAMEYIPVAKALNTAAVVSDYETRVRVAGNSGEAIELYQNNPTDQATASNNIINTLRNILNPQNQLEKYWIGAGVTTGLTATVTGIAALIAGGIGATPIGWGVAAFTLFGLTALAATNGLQNLLSWLTEQEPITIMLLNQDGNPLQAGLKGADGIIVGQPSTLPVVSDLIGIHDMADDPTTFWNAIGFSLGQGTKIKMAETILKTRKMAQAVMMSGRLELGYAAGVGTNEVFTCQIKSLHDGDTVYTASPVGDLATRLGVNRSNEIRLKFIDAPEIEDSIDYETNLVKKRVGMGAADVRDWLVRRLNTKVGSPTDARQTYYPNVKVIVNNLQPHDNYGRILGILVDRASCAKGGDESLFDRNADLASPRFDWLRYSINGEMLRDPEMSKWVVPFIFFPGYSQVTGEEQFLGDSTGIYSNQTPNDPGTGY